MICSPTTSVVMPMIDCGEKMISVMPLANTHFYRFNSVHICNNPADRISKDYKPFL